MDCDSSINEMKVNLDDSADAIEENDMCDKCPSILENKKWWGSLVYACIIGNKEIKAWI